MASNKNQHFVPRCYLRPFTLDEANVAINIFNVDRRKTIQNAPVKHQCSGDYFYGTDAALEKALQFAEGAYASALKRILSTSYVLSDDDRQLLRQFWLLQHMRTEAASRRAVEMSDGMLAAAGSGSIDFRLRIKEAVIMAMRIFVDTMDTVGDVKVCLLKNQTGVPFITSDDPAVLTNRWYMEHSGARGRAFGLTSCGALMLLPLSPTVLCLGYDGDMYSVPHQNGWAAVTRAADVHALNEHQFLNCRANVFLRDIALAESVRQEFERVKDARPATRYRVHRMVLHTTKDGYKRYRVVDRELVPSDKEALIHTEVVQPRPHSWPTIVGWRTKPVAYNNGTGVGFLRRAWAMAKEYDPPFQKFAAR